MTVDQLEPSLPTIDISRETGRHVIFAAGTEQVYQGRLHTLLLPDGKTTFCVWTQDHGAGVLLMKRSDDGGYGSKPGLDPQKQEGHVRCGRS